MRTSTAFLAVAGTIVAAIVLGVSGGLLIGDVMSAKSPKGAEMSRLERRMSSPEPVPATASAAASVAPSEPAVYLAAPQLIAALAPVAESTQPQRADTAAAQPAMAQTVASQPGTAAATPVAREQMGAPDAAAKARDADVKRAMDKRRAERHQQWAEKQRQRQMQEQQIAEDAQAPDQAEPRQEMVAQPVRIELPFVRLFGAD